MWTANKISDLATGYWNSAALSTAVELHLFDALSAAPSTAHDLAAKLNLSELHLDALLTSLVSLELLSRDGDTYTVHETARPYLDPGSATCMLSALRFNSMMYPLWGSLADCVRSGAPVVPPTSHLGSDPQRTEQFVRGMHSRALGFLAPMAQAIDLHGATRLLDVGSGPGTFSREIARQSDGLTVTQLDLPPILEAARVIAAEDPADGIEYCPADYRGDELPGNQEAVLYCGALHQEDPETASALCAKLHGSLVDGGLCHVVDLMLDNDRTGPVMSALFSLNMMLTSPRGRVFAVQETVGLLEGAGFKDVDTASIPSTPYHRVTGWKR